MNEHLSEVDMSTPRHEQVGRFRQLWRKVFPYQVQQYDPATFTVEPTDIVEVDVDPIAELPDESIGEQQSTEVENNDTGITVALARNGDFLLFNGDEPNPYDHLSTDYDSRRLFRGLATMYIPRGPGEFSNEDVATSSGYKESTVATTANQLGTFLPAEIIKSQHDMHGNLRISFGNLALVSLVSEEIPGFQSETNAPTIHEQIAAEIDKGKVDLTTQDHAIIQVGASHFYLPLQSYEGILAARTIEALRDWEKNTPRSADIADKVWRSMTVAERTMFAPNEEDTFPNDSFIHVEVPVIRVLRRLTNQLMMTHERHNDRFTILTREIDVTYADQPLSEEDALLNPRLRPVAPPTNSTESVDDARQLEYTGLAREYMRQAMKRKPLVDADAIDMLSFIMSPSGHWAIKEVAGEDGLFKSHSGAMYAMHTYLRANFHGYGPAYRSRLIKGGSGTRGRSNRSVRHVSGRLPGDTKWVLGRGINELFNDLQEPLDT